MKNSKFKKGLVFIIFFLIFGTNFFPNVLSISDEKKSILLNKNIIISNTPVFDRLITFFMKLGHMPSLSACIIKKDEVVWAKGYGLYDIKHDKTADVDTIYAVASISKTVTATALMLVYDDGLFGLDDDINDYLNFSLRNPNHPDDPITFRMLLAHQSSLASDRDTWHLHKDYPGDCPITFYPFLKEYLTPGGCEYSPEAWSDSHPGEKYQYSGMGYAIIGLLIEQITGEPFDEYCKNNIFIPLEMNNSSFRFADIDQNKLAVPYIYCFWGYEPYMHAGDVDYPSGCLRTSIMDLSNFLIAHMNNGQFKDVEILNPSTVKLMHSPRFSESRYGLGFQIWEKPSGKNIVGHSGSNIGVSTVMKYQVSDDESIIYFTNRMSTLLIENLAQQFIEKLLFSIANFFF